jgi:catechol 2,3-dioxygenase-like lactoylglutathione lyase family enzyme
MCALYTDLRLIAFCTLNWDTAAVPKIVNSWCVLAVRDLEVSTRYYVDVLGFRKDPINAEGWSFLTRDTFRVMLGECANERPAGELGDHSYFAYWNVEGVDELYQELLAKGAIILSPPTNKPWGLREFGMRTPDGHRIMCGEPI